MSSINLIAEKVDHRGCSFKEERRLRIVDLDSHNIIEFTLKEFSVNEICEDLNKDLGWSKQAIKNAVINCLTEKE